MTLGAVGIHGETGTGMQGAGVNTPKAAAVRAITIGFAGLVHIPKGSMFKKGTIEKMLAAGIKSAIVIVKGGTIKGVGATPNAHLHKAPIETVGPAILLSFFFLG